MSSLPDMYAPLSPVQVFAAGAIDVNKAVHLKIQYIHDKTPVSDVPFDLYYVASVDAYGEFTLAGDFQKYPVVVNGEHRCVEDPCRDACRVCRQGPAQAAG